MSRFALLLRNPGSRVTKLASCVADPSLSAAQVCLLAGKEYPGWRVIGVQPGMIFGLHSRLFPFAGARSGLITRRAGGVTPGPTKDRVR